MFFLIVGPTIRELIRLLLLFVAILFSKSLHFEETERIDISLIKAIEKLADGNENY